MSVWFYIVVCASAGSFATAALVGQPVEVPVNSSKVLTAARFAVQVFNRNNIEDPFTYKLLNITSAKVQVVAGINYILDVQLGRAKCKKSDAVKSEPCVYFFKTKCTVEGYRNNVRVRHTKDDFRQRAQVGPRCHNYMCSSGSKDEGDLSERSG